MSIIRNTAGRRAIFQIEAIDVDGKAMLEIWWGQLTPDAATDMKFVGRVPDTQSMRRMINSHLERDAKNDVWLEPEQRFF